MWKAIEGYDDELAAEAKKQEAFLRQQVCPECGSDVLSKEFLSALSDGKGVTFIEGELLPQPMMRCQNCHALFNPNSNIVIERPFKHVT